MAKGRRLRGADGRFVAAPRPDGATVLQPGRGRPRQLRKAQERGWTRKRRAVFLDHLAATCNVTASATAAGLHWSSAYALRRRDSAFAEQWKAALATGYEGLEAMLIARARGAAAAAPEAEDGPAPPDPAAMDAELALHLLRQHAGAVAGRVRRPGGKLRRASSEELTGKILRLLAALARRRERRRR